MVAGSCFGGCCCHRSHDRNKPPKKVPQAPDLAIFPSMKAAWACAAGSGTCTKQRKEAHLDRFILAESMNRCGSSWRGPLME